MTATATGSQPRTGADAARVRLVLDELRAEGIGDQVAAWREAALQSLAAS